MIPGLGRSPGEGKGYPFQYSGLENSIHGVAKSRMRPSNLGSHFHFLFFTFYLFIHLFLLVGGQLLYDIVVVFAIH